MDIFIALLTGIGLAAACGFRVFVPLFLVSLCLNSGVEMPFGLDTVLQALVGDDMAWLGQPMVTVGLGVAMVVEIGGFYVPWVDNLLDTIASPAAIVAGTMLSGALMPEVFGDGAMKWAAAIIAGGGSSGLVQATTVLARGTSSATTGGFGNPLVATLELFASVLTTVFAVLIPILVIGLLVAVVLFGLKLFGRRNPDPSPG